MRSSRRSNGLVRPHTFELPLLMQGTAPSGIMRLQSCMTAPCSCLVAAMPTVLLAASCLLWTGIVLMVHGAQ